MKFVKIYAMIISVLCVSFSSKRVHKLELSKDRDIPCTYTLIGSNECTKYKKAECDFKWKVCRLKDGNECQESRNGFDEETGCLSKSQCVDGICKSRDTLFGKILRVSNTLGIPLREKRKKY